MRARKGLYDWISVRVADVRADAGMLLVRLLARPIRMRVLLTSTCLSGTVLAVMMAPSMVAEAQGIVVPNRTSSPTSTFAAAQQESLFSATSLPTLRGSDTEPNPQPATPRALDPTRGRVRYPVRPVQPAGVEQRPVTPVSPDQGQAVRDSRGTDAFDAVGVKLGSFLFYPSLSLFAEATDNIDNAQNGETGRSGRVELEVTAQSLWERHALALGAKGVFTSYQTPNRKPDNELSLNADLTLDLAEQTELGLSARLNRQKEEANNPDLVASGGTASIETAYNLSAELDQGAGPLKLQLRGSLDREVFDEDASRDFRTYTLGARVGYEVTDQVLPFVDVEVARKRYDQSNSSQDGQSLRGAIGVQVVNREKLSGEISVGAMVWDPQNGNLDNETIFFADASVNWSPNALWSLRGGLETSLTSSSTSATAVATRTLSVGADFSARRDLNLSLDASLAHETYRGSDRKDWVFDATLGAEYAFNRSVQLIARVGHEWRDSNLAGSDFTSNKIEVGI